MGAYEGSAMQEEDEVRRRSEAAGEAKRRSYGVAQMSREAVANGELRGAPLGLTSPKAMGGSAFGPEPPADRLTALVDVLRAKTSAGRMLAIEAGIRAGHVTLAEALEWMGGET